VSPVIGIADEDEDAIEPEGNDLCSQKQHGEAITPPARIPSPSTTGIRTAVGRKDGIGIMVEHGVHNVRYCISAIAVRFHSSPGCLAFIDTLSLLQWQRPVDAECNPTFQLPQALPGD
jgi:hypothetical protein